MMAQNSRKVPIFSTPLPFPRSSASRSQTITSQEERDEQLRDAYQIQRDHRARVLEETIGGRDLISIALSDDPNVVMQFIPFRDTILGRASYFRDQQAMLRRITNCVTNCRDHLINNAANPQSTKIPISLDAWKLLFCDVRLLPDEEDSLQTAYEAQLRDDRWEPITELERAKEVVRTEKEKLARRNAKLVIPFLENQPAELQASLAVDPVHLDLSKNRRHTWTDMDADFAARHLTDGVNATKRIWEQVSPPAPAWIQHIVNSGESWGYVAYKTTGVNERYGGDWATTWSEIEKNTSYWPWPDFDPSIHDFERSVGFACLSSIHCPGYSFDLKKAWTLDWQDTPVAGGGLDSDQAIRQHFRNYAKTLPSSSGILQNTFIVVDDDPIPHDFWSSVSRVVDIFWVWAYDADWDPSSEDDSAQAEGDGERRYEGKVRVAIYSLDAWFYAARVEGVSLRDMWKKAQQRPDKVWMCFTKALENWDHEPFV